MRRLTALTAALTLLTVGAAQAAGVNAIKDWWAVCNNRNTCVAFAWPRDENEIAWLRLERKGDAGAPVTAVLAVYAEDDLDVGGGPWFLDVDGKPVPGLAALYPTQDGNGYWRLEIPAANTRALAIAARDGSALKLTRRKRDPLTLSLHGGAATMIWIDEQQGRIGSPTALGRATGQPKAIVAPAKPVIAAGPEQPQTGLPKVMPASVLKAIGECESLAETASSAIIARLSPGVVLYAPVCSRRAYNDVFGLVLADEAGRGARMISLPLPEGYGQSNISDPMNIDYDPTTRVMTSFSKGRGLGDCGDETQWVWDGTAFRVSYSLLMSKCRGVSVDDWPELFQAEVR